MASGICCRQALPLPEGIDLLAAEHYYGVRCPDAQAAELLAQLAPGILAVAVPRMAWAEYDIKTDTGLFAGRDVAAHLVDCTQAVLLGVTLGSGVDAAVRRAAVGDVAAGAAADALASALTEQCCDAAEALLRQAAERKDRYLTGRFSPGYGDWPIAVQKRIAVLLDLPKNLGVTVTDTCLMLPRKSVTAVLGVAEHPVMGKRAGCANCALRDKCEYRKRGNTCENKPTVSL